MPLTNIITLTENRPEYLAEARASVDAQTDRDWEHLIYDRGLPSTDDSRIWCSDKRVRFRLPALEPSVFTVGAHWNILLGLVSPEAKYVTILDDDNRKRPDFIEKMIAPMEADESIEAVSCGWALIDGEGRPKLDCQGEREERHDNLETSLLRLWRDNTIDSNALVFRRSVLDKIGRFDPTLTTNEDWHFVIRLVRHCKMVHLPDCLLDYRVHGGARSREAVGLGAHANWHRIRKELFTKDEWRRAIAAAEVEGL